MLTRLIPEWLALLLLAYACLTPHFIYLGPPLHYREAPDMTDPSLQDPNGPCDSDTYDPWYPSCTNRVLQVT